MLDLLGRRWSLRVLWELRKQTRKFRDLREACDDVSPSVLNQRLGELRYAGVVEHATGGYALTPRGASLLGVLAPLEGWANRWPLDASRAVERPRAAPARPKRATMAAPAAPAPKTRARARAVAAPARRATTRRPPRA